MTQITRIIEIHKQKNPRYPRNPRLIYPSLCKFAVAFQICINEMETTYIQRN